MLPNAFLEKPEPPTDGELKAALGKAKSLWDDLLARLKTECELADQEWNSYSRKAGWALRLKKKKRNIIYLSPHKGSFSVSLVLGDKAVSAARESALPPKVIAMIEEGKRYPEGTAVRMDVTGPKDLANIVGLTDLKLRF